MRGSIDFCADGTWDSASVLSLLHGDERTAVAHALRSAALVAPRTCISMIMSYFAQGLKVAVVEGHDIGGTCVNRGCVPSKALLAASGRVRELRDTMHLKSMGIQVSAATPSLRATSGFCRFLV